MRAASIAPAAGLPGPALQSTVCSCLHVSYRASRFAEATSSQTRRSSSRRASTSGRVLCTATEPLTPALSGSDAAEPCALRQKHFDVVALSNLCVDIVVHVDELPPPDTETRQQLLQSLTARPPPQEQWEVGGNTNFLIAASRLGLKAASVGHLGSDVYGAYMRDVLRAEGVRNVEPVAVDSLTPEQDQTLLCFVLVAPDGKHAFCSRYDFGPWPLLSFVEGLPAGVHKVLQNTEALFINGFVFDELPAGAVLAAARTAQAAGAAVFFDPGPRSWTFNEGERKAALEAMLDASEVVCMTEEEAEAVTGLGSAEQQARFILSRPGACTQWCVIKRGAEGAILASRSQADQVYRQQALQVDVRDTVGCGDSFAAAVVLGFIRDHSIPAVMALANAVGAATAMGRGAGRNVAKAEQVETLLQSALPQCADGRHKDALNLLHCSLSSIDFDAFVDDEVQA